jgi:hypothetical protein
MDQLVKEATEMTLHPNNTNRQEGLRLRKTWNLNASIPTCTYQRSTKKKHREEQANEQLW